jgi:hypothetical protein
MTSRPYNRRRDLKRFTKRISGPAVLWPQDIEDESIDGRMRVIAVLEALSRRMRNAGVAGHWAYDFLTHDHVNWCLENERRELAALQPAREAAE